MTKEKHKRKDKWMILAKEQGFRARSAFKLVQLNQKYNFLSGARALIDLCAAPGGWLQVARKFMPVSSLVIGVDLMPIRSIPNVTTLQEDITTPSCRAALKKHLASWKVDVVLHDGSPKMGQAWLQDAYTQSDLVLKSLKLATEFLVPNGIFITKVFRSADYNALMFIFNQLFKKVDVTKPIASRNTSAEIYVVCQGYLKPDKIDPRLLDSKYVFKEVDDNPTPRDVFAKKQKPSREGYEAGNYTLHKKTSIADFVNSTEPVPMLSLFNQFVFDDAAAEFMKKRETTPEIKNMCEDLRLLGKGDFKSLLRWRLRMREYRKIEAETIAAAAGPAQLSEEDEQKIIEDELEQRLAAIAARDKREKKKARERKQKQQRRIELGILNPNDVFDAPADESLFALDTIRTGDALKQVAGKGDAEASERSKFDTADWSSMPDLEQLESSSEDEEEKIAEDGDDYDTVLEKYLDNMYNSYASRAKKRGVELFHKIKKPDAFEEEGDSLHNGVETMEEEEYRENVRQENPLLVKPKTLVAPPSSQVDLWFANKIFQDGDDDKEEEEGQDMDDDSDDSDEDLQEFEESEEEEEAVPVKKQPTTKKQQAVASKQQPQSQSKADPKQQPAKQQQAATKQQPKKPQQLKQLTGRQNGSATVIDDDDEPIGKGQKRKRKMLEAEEVPKADPKFDKHGLFAKPKPGQPQEEEEEEAKSESSDESEDYEEDDDDEKSVTLAIGRKLHEKKKRRRDMEDDAYNRYAFNDDDLPAWFEDDENRHNKPQLPITKEEADLMKMKWRAIDARPQKKVLEAKARKKKRAMKKMEKMKKKALEVAKTGDLSEKEKIRTIEKLYKQAGQTKRLATTYIVRRKFQGGKGPGTGKHSRVKIVDPRMKKDKKAEKVSQAHKKGKRFDQGAKRRKHTR